MHETREVEKIFERRFFYSSCTCSLFRPMQCETCSDKSLFRFCSCILLWSQIPWFSEMIFVRNKLSHTMNVVRRNGPKMKYKPRSRMDCTCAMYVYPLCSYELWNVMKWERRFVYSISILFIYFWFIFISRHWNSDERKNQVPKRRVNKRMIRLNIYFRGSFVI